MRPVLRGFVRPEFPVQGGRRGFLNDAAIIAFEEVVFDLGFNRGRQSAL